MIPYELIEHIADAQFRAYGATMEEAFVNSARAMTAIVVEPDEVSLEREVPMAVQAADPQRLLFDFLDQILFLIDTQKFIVGNVRDLGILHQGGVYLLSATLQGDDVLKYGGNLKAVTYHDMKVEMMPDGRWLCQAVIDI
jgi:SHS2 domain-containing protein